MIARILTPWTGEGTPTSPNRPLLDDIFPVSWQDVTAQSSENLKPDPNLYVIEVVCSAEVLSQIEADNRFMVLWSDDA